MTGDENVHASRYPKRRGGKQGRKKKKSERRKNDRALGVLERGRGKKKDIEGRGDEKQPKNNIRLTQTKKASGRRDTNMPTCSSLAH